MVFKDNFVVVVVVNGQILREHDGAVTLPFGSDYSLKLKNMESRRAVISISIDGQDVLGGSRLVMNANSETTLEGFLDGDNVRHAFRFIQKDADVVKHRGDGIDDGIIRVEYRFEQRKAEHIHIDRIYHYPYWYWRPYTVTWEYRPHPLERNRKFYTSDNTVSHKIKGMGSQDVCYSGMGGWECAAGAVNDVCRSVPADDEGITVKGANRNQHFHHTSVGGLEENAHVITLRLRGVKSNGTGVEKPVTVRDKLQCPTCGRKWKSYVKYCGHCATRLI